MDRKELEQKRRLGFADLFRGHSSAGLADEAAAQGARARDWMIAALLRAQGVWSFLRLRPAGPDRARAAHRAVDHALAERGTDMAAVSCRAGCAHCCHIQVDATGDEVELLAELVEKGLTIDMGALKVQAKADDLDKWRRLTKDQRRCVFLGDDNRCRVYEDRPSVCRSYFVISPPDDCRELTGRSMRLLVTKAEIAVSAAFNLDNGEPKPMVTELLRRLKGGPRGK